MLDISFSQYAAMCRDKLTVGSIKNHKKQMAAFRKKTTQGEQENSKEVLCDIIICLCSRFSLQIIDSVSTLGNASCFSSRKLSVLTL